MVDVQNWNLRVAKDETERDAAIAALRRTFERPVKAMNVYRNEKRIVPRVCYRCSFGEKCSMFACCSVFCFIFQIESFVENIT